MLRQITWELEALTRQFPDITGDHLTAKPLAPFSNAHRRPSRPITTDVAPTELKNPPGTSVYSPTLVNPDRPSLRMVIFVHRMHPGRSLRIESGITPFSTWGI